MTGAGALRGARTPFQPAVAACAFHAASSSFSFSRVMPARTSARRSAGRAPYHAIRSCTVVANGRNVSPAAIAFALLTVP